MSLVEPRAPVDDLTSILRNIQDRLYRLEQRTAMVSGGSFPDGIVVGPSTDPFPVGTIASPPEGPLVAVAGSHNENIFIDLSWTAPSNNTAARFQVELALKDEDDNYELINYFQTSASSLRIDRLLANKTYGIRVYSLSRVGVPSDPLPDEGYLDILTVPDAVLPPAVTNVIAARGATTVIVTFDGVSIGDLDLYQVQVGSDRSFQVFASEEYTTSTVLSFPWTTADIPHARVRAIDTSGNAGPWATSSPPSGDTTVVDAMIVGGLDASRLQFGEADGDIIRANTIHVNKLLDASFLTAKTIGIGAGGVIKVGNPPSTGLFINDQGISLYSSGQRVVYLDALTGTGTFQGTVSGSSIVGSTITGGVISGTVYRSINSTTAQRIEILTTGEDANKVLFHQGPGFEPGYIYNDYNFVGGSRIYINSPRPEDIFSYASIYLATRDDGDTDISLSAKGVYVGGFLDGSVTLDAGQISIGTWDGTRIDLVGEAWLTPDRSLHFGAGGVLSSDQGGSIALGHRTIPQTPYLDWWQGTTHAARLITHFNNRLDAEVNEFYASSNLSGAPVIDRSSIKIKKDVKDLVRDETKFLQMRPVTYKYRENLSDQTFSGLVAEEIYAIFPEAVTLNAEDEPEGIVSAALLSILISQVQEITKIVRKMEKK